LQALSDNFERINTMAEKLTPTIGESLTIAFDKVKLKMHELNKETGFSKKLSEVIFSVAENVDKIALAVGAAAGAWVAWKAALIVVNGLLFANNALLTVHAIASGSAMVNVALITGLLWKKAAALAAVQLALGPVAILIGALSASFIVLAGHNSEALKSLERMQKVGKEKGLVSYRDDVGLASDAVARLNDNTGAFVLRTPEAVDAIAEQSGFFGKASVGVGVYAKALKDGVLKIKDKDKATFNYTKSLAKLNEQYLKDKNVEKYNQALRKLEIAKLNFEFKEGKITLEKYNKGLEEIRLGKHISALKQFKGELGELNQKFASEVRAGNVVGYARALDSIRLTKMKNEAKEGKISLLEMNSQLRDASLTEFNRRLAEGSTTLSQYNAGTQAINFAKINEEWKAGTLNAADYNKAIVETTEKFNPDSAFFVGTNDYIKQAGTVSQNVATAITNTFGNLEQTFLDFTKTGKLNFKSFANAVLEDLQRILVRSMLIRPLAQGLMGALSPTDRAGGTTGYSSDYLSGNTGGYAKGGAFKGGVEFFAKGGVVSSPTAFGMRNGMGIMGEKGPEAILPLRRDGSGDLGVKATTSPVIVNIHNENGGEVEQTERQGPNGERILDILITKKIKETFANGSMDKQMSSSYGLRRRGV
jgi:lambda family phage tail tape measure protein